MQRWNYDLGTVEFVTTEYSFLIEAIAKVEVSGAEFDDVWTFELSKG
jgi:hypothetical protein